MVEAHSLVNEDVRISYLMPVAALLRGLRQKCLCSEGDVLCLHDLSLYFFQAF